MRPIKFQAWDGKFMYEVTWLDLKDGKVFLVEGYVVGGSAKGSLHQSEIKAIRQFTGWHDHKGQEVYEGDIVQIDKFRGVVVWDTIIDGWRIRVHDTYNLRNNEMVVIGNVYEQPELIKKQEEEQP